MLVKHKVIISIFILTTGCLVLYWIIIGYPIKKFTEEEEEGKSIAQFDFLNDSIAKEIPSPLNGIQFKKTSRLGMDISKPIHGRLLVLYYTVTREINNTAYEDVLVYYQSDLQSKGWEAIENNRSIYFRGIELKKGTACIMIEFIRDDYEISIWHDYLKQSFSPTLPSKWLLEIFDVGKTDIWTCPYEF